jgi:hypothetical protein
VTGLSIANIAVIVVLVKAAILQYGDSLSQRFLELDHAWQLLIKAVSGFHALDVRPQRFGQIDCGEHLHHRPKNGPTILAHVNASVSDIRHRGSSG